MTRLQGFLFLLFFQTIALLLLNLNWKQDLGLFVYVTAMIIFWKY